MRDPDLQDTSNSRIRSRLCCFRQKPIRMDTWSRLCYSTTVVPGQRDGRIIQSGMIGSWRQYNGSIRMQFQNAFALTAADPRLFAGLTGHKPSWTGWTGIYIRSIGNPDQRMLTLTCVHVETCFSRGDIPDQFRVFNEAITGACPACPFLSVSAHSLQSYQTLSVSR